MTIHIATPDQPDYPTTLHEAAAKVASGEISATDTLAWHVGLPDWVPLSQLLASQQPASMAAEIERQAAASARYQRIENFGSVLAGTMRLLLIGCGTVTFIWSLVIAHSHGFLALIATFCLPPFSQLFWLWQTWEWPSLSGYAIAFVSMVVFALLERFTRLLFGLSSR